MAYDILCLSAYHYHLPVIASHYQSTSSDILRDGICNNCTSHGLDFLSVLGGLLGDKYQFKWLVAFAIGIMGLGSFLRGFATSFATLFLFSIVIGVGIALIYPQSSQNGAICLSLRAFWDRHWSVQYWSCNGSSTGLAIAIRASFSPWTSNTSA